MSAQGTPRPEREGVGSEVEWMLRNRWRAREIAEQIRDRRDAVFGTDAIMALIEDALRARLSTGEPSEVARLRQRWTTSWSKWLVGQRQVEGTSHSTACSIWGDDGLGGTVEGFDNLPCNCGALVNHARSLAAPEPVEGRERVEELENALRDRITKAYTGEDTERAMHHTLALGLVERLVDAALRTPPEPVGTDDTRGYVLDGVPTAMEWIERNGIVTMHCPCGWSTSVDHDRSHLAPVRGKAARERQMLRYDVMRFRNWDTVRFHFAHCRRAAATRGGLGR